MTTWASHGSPMTPTFALWQQQCACSCTKAGVMWTSHCGLKSLAGQHANKIPNSPPKSWDFFPSWTISGLVCIYVRVMTGHMTFWPRKLLMADCNNLHCTIITMIIRGQVNNTHHVNTLPSVVRATENCRPHLTFATSPKLGIVLGTFDPSLPPRPSLPKSPSPHDHIVPWNEVIPILYTNIWTCKKTQFQYSSLQT